MGFKTNRQRLEHDRAMLRRMLGDYETGAMAHLDEAEQMSIVEGIARRIAEINARIRALDGA